jgi:hypothetical protein
MCEGYYGYYYEGESEKQTEKKDEGLKSDQTKEIYKKRGNKNK